MLKNLIIALLVIFLFVALRLEAGAQGVEVNVRTSENPEGKRIVFESTDETFIKNTSAHVSKDSIKIRFPSAPVLRYKNETHLDLSIQGNVVNIRFKEPFRIKTLYLSAPPRFSIDIFTLSQEATQQQESKATTSITPALTRIMIDPGHGGYDSGIIIDSMREKDITLAIAREMESLLRRKNRPVILTRRMDQFISITDRAIAANQKTPGIFISLHLSSTDGFVVYKPYNIDSGEQTEALFDMNYRQRPFVDRSRALAEAMGKAIKEDLKVDVIFREVPVSLLNSIGAPAIMVEFPRVAVDDKEKRMRLSQTLLKGIDYVQ